MTGFAERLGDMHPTRGVRITEHKGGDISISITDNGTPLPVEGEVGNDTATVEFCVNGTRSSSRVRAALLALKVALEVENEQNPIR